MPIQSAVPSGDLVFVYDDRGQVMFSVPLGTDPESGLVGYSSSGVSVRRGGIVTTYDERGHAVRTVPFFTRQTHRENSPPRNGDGSPSKLLLVFVVGALAIAIFSPGLVAVAALTSRLPLSLETPQVWTFAIASSLALWIAFYLVSRNLGKASIRYFILCVCVVAVFLFAHFGLKTRFTEQTIRLYFPPK